MGLLFSKSFYCLLFSCSLSVLGAISSNLCAMSTFLL